jgi:hypothetical protein
MDKPARLTKIESAPPGGVRRSRSKWEAFLKDRFDRSFVPVVKEDCMRDLKLPDVSNASEKSSP